MAGKGTISITFKLDGDGKGFKAIAQDAKGLRTIMTSTLEQSEALKTSLVNWSAAVQGLQSVDRAVNQISSTLSSITSESAEFNKAMKEANTMAGKDSAGFKQLKGEVADLAKEIPIARDQLANGLYQTISNGVPENNWIEFLNTSARSAVGGLADINKVVGVTSTLIKNYGLEWSAAADIQDKIQLTAKNGVTSFEQLAQALPRVAGNASSLGVSIDELMGTFATLTGVSGNTAEVSTQLAAIFTSLVKPSSEAAEMAAKMGIQFDAAAIKAAGGFQNFLAQLNDSVKAYAQANGVLEQEVYGRLFGSAEALRALIPLQGELSDKFAANVSNMVNSAGTMDAAYADMSSHGEAVTQMLRNQWAAVVDVISGVTSAAQPYINFTAGLLSTGSSAAILITTFKQLNIQQTLVAARAKLASVAMVTLGLRGKSTAAVMRVFSAAMKGSAYSATALKIALRGLLIATGVGAAIAAVTTVIEHLVSVSDNATDAVKELDEATDAYKQAATDAKLQIDKDIKSLGALIVAKKDTTDAIQHLNDVYGESLGTYKTAKEWYDILTQKSQLYVKQIGYEAQARVLAAKMAEAAIKKEMAAEEMKSLEDAGAAKRTVVSGIGSSVTGYAQTLSYEADTKEYAAAKKAREEAEMEETSLKAKLDAIAKLTGRVAEEMNVGASTAKINISPTFSKTDSVKPRWYEDASRLKEIESNIKILQGRLQTATEEEAKFINRQITLWQKKADAIRNAGKTPDFDPKKIEEVNALIAKQTAVVGNYVGKVKKAKAEFIDLGVQWHEQPRNIKEINDNLSILRAQLDNASFEDAAGINQQIESLNALAEGYRNAGMAAVDASAYVSQVGSVMQSLSSVLGDAGAGWLSWSANVCQAVAQALPALRTLVNALQAKAAGEAASQSASMGPFGWIAGIAAMGSILAAFATLPKFANGGIISGPTVGLMGEYPGAANNPEVVAPLDKLQDLIAPANNLGGTVTFRIDGRTLVGILNKENSFSSRRR